MKLNSSVRALALLVGGATGACATFGARATPGPESDVRTAIMARSQVWSPTNIRAMNVKAGPQEPGAFGFRATVACEYLDKTLQGQSPKFACTIGKKDEVKVKYGGANGEVYGEVLATRLLWVLGFPADRMYPVTVICRGCPAALHGIERSGDETRFDPAVIEREMPRTEWPPKGEKGWSWNELNLVNPELGGAPRADRDALTLLAVLLQHTDSKPEQQRILCVDRRSVRSPGSCGRPFLMINDLGLTFGRTSRTNANDAGSVNLAAWRRTPVWKDEKGCTGNLSKSFTGTLDNPVISEGGRRFLSNLLAQLSDRQLRDLFETARVHLRLRAPEDVASGFATIDEWVDAFKQKRDEIAQRRCA